MSGSMRRAAVGLYGVTAYGVQQRTDQPLGGEPILGW